MITTALVFAFGVLPIGAGSSADAAATGQLSALSVAADEPTEGSPEADFVAWLDERGIEAVSPACAREADDTGWLCYAIDPDSASVITVAFFDSGEEPILRTFIQDEADASDRPASDTIGSGTHLVGTDVAPGRYRTVVPDGSFGCYWERLSGLSGEFGDIITNGLAEPGDQTFIEISESDEAFSSEGCGTWERVES